MNNYVKVLGIVAVLVLIGYCCYSILQQINHNSEMDKLISQQQKDLIKQADSLADLKCENKDITCFLYYINCRWSCTSNDLYTKQDEAICISNCAIDLNESAFIPTPKAKNITVTHTEYVTTYIDKTVYNIEKMHTNYSVVLNVASESTNPATYGVIDTKQNPFTDITIYNTDGIGNYYNVTLTLKSKQCPNNICVANYVKIWINEFSSVHLKKTWDIDITNGWNDTEFGYNITSYETQITRIETIKVPITTEINVTENKTIYE